MSLRKKYPLMLFFETTFIFSYAHKQFLEPVPASKLGPISQWANARSMACHLHVLAQNSSL
jgi:hypothetical protein